MYETEIYELRRQIDRLDNELIDKLCKMSQFVKCYKQNINSDTEYVPFVNSDIKKLARDKKLDEKAVLKIFKEISHLINEQEANPK